MKKGPPPLKIIFLILPILCVSFKVMDVTESPSVCVKIELCAPVVFRLCDKLTGIEQGLRCLRKNKHFTINTVKSAESV